MKIIFNFICFMIYINDFNTLSRYSSCESMLEEEESFSSLKDEINKFNYYI